MKFVRSVHVSYCLVNRSLNVVTLGLGFLENLSFLSAIAVRAEGGSCNFIYLRGEVPGIASAGAAVTRVAGGQSGTSCAIASSVDVTH